MNHDITITCNTAIKAEAIIKWFDRHNIGASFDLISYQVDATNVPDRTITPLRQYLAMHHPSSVINGLPLRGMLVDVYHSPNGDFTANGVSSKVDHMILVGKNVPEIHMVQPGDVVVELIPSQQGGKKQHAAPHGETRWTMFGGNFIYTSHSAFAELSHDGNPIPVFDRIENSRS